MAVFGALASSFARGAAMGVSRLAGMYAAGDAAKPDFNALYAKVISGTKVGFDIKDLQHLMTTLNSFDPALTTKFKKDALKLANPAKNAVRKAFVGQKIQGPLGAVKRPGRQFDKMYTNGRLSWASSRSMRNVVDVNYKGRPPASIKKLTTAQDKTLSVVRVRVRGAAFIMADMAGKSNRARKLTGDRTRPYQINLFGRGVVTRDHKVNFQNVENWLTRLNVTSDQKKPSRYAYPALEKHTPEYQKNISALVNEVIADTNRRMQS